MHITHLLYLHGFRSSPQSFKARLMHQCLRERHPQLHWWCPQLPPSPQKASALIADGVRAWPTAGWAVVGSSLGGFYATWATERLGAQRAVVLNPAVDPARDLAAHIGEQSSWHDPEERFFFRPEYVDELRSLEVGPLRQPERYLAVIAQGDELLDWREMAARYAGAHQRVIQGSNHALSDFARHLDVVLAFLRLPPPAG